MRDRLTDLADDALDRLDRLQRWWREQSPHPALTQILLATVAVLGVLAIYSGDGTDAGTRTATGAAVCIGFAWLAGVTASFRTRGSLRREPAPAPNDDATRDIDPSAADARRRFRLWSACFWWLQLPWLVVVIVQGVLRSVALVAGSETSRVGLGCSQVPLWALSVPMGLWIWQRHYRRASRSLGSRTEADLDSRVFWSACASLAAGFVWAGLLIV